MNKENFYLAVGKGKRVKTEFKNLNLKDLKFYVITSLFIPGAHFKDVKGKPMNSEQFNLLDRLDPTGFNKDRIPNLGNDTAFAFNVGFEYAF